MLNWNEIKEKYNKLRCALFGHSDFKTTIYFSHSMQKIKCKRCGKAFGINHSAKALLDWDTDLENHMRKIYPEKFDGK